MKKVVLALALSFGFGLISNTVMAADNSVNTEVRHDSKEKKEKKKKKKKKKAESCTSNGEKKSCCAHGSEKKN